MCGGGGGRARANAHNTTKEGEHHIAGIRTCMTAIWMMIFDGFQTSVPYNRPPIDGILGKLADLRHELGVVLGTGCRGGGRARRTQMGRQTIRMNARLSVTGRGHKHTGKKPKREEAT